MDVYNVKLEVETLQASRAKLRISWKTKFSAQEYMSKQAVKYDVYLENVGGVGDVDVRRRRVVYAWDIASEQPKSRSVVTRWIDRDWLDEDFTVWGIGDTTDEWRAEVICSPHPMKSDSAKSSILRKEFG